MNVNQKIARGRRSDVLAFSVPEGFAHKHECTPRHGSVKFASGRVYVAVTVGALELATKKQNGARWGAVYRGGWETFFASAPAADLCSSRIPATRF